MSTLSCEHQHDRHRLRITRTSLPCGTACCLRWADPNVNTTKPVSWATRIQDNQLYLHVASVSASVLDVAADSRSAAMLQGSSKLINASNCAATPTLCYAWGYRAPMASQRLSGAMAVRLLGSCAVLCTACHPASRRPRVLGSHRSRQPRVAGCPFVAGTWLRQLGCVRAPHAVRLCLLCRPRPVKGMRALGISQSTRAQRRLPLGTVADKISTSTGRRKLSPHSHGTGVQVTPLALALALALNLPF